MIDALSLIRRFEGFRETPYWDVNALRTGYGSDTVTMPDGSVVPVGQGTRVTREDAERDLARRVQTEFMPKVASAVGRDLFQNLSVQQRAALASITYNYGSLPDIVVQAVQSGDPSAVTTAIRSLAGHNDGINADRRNEEADIYGGSSGDASPPTDYTRLAYAYANGKMTPEDEAIYERGMGEGVFPKASKQQAVQEQQPDPLAIYARTVGQRRQPQTVQLAQSAPARNATPLQRYPGL